MIEPDPPSRADGQRARSEPGPIRQLTLSVYLPTILVAIGQQAMMVMLPLYAIKVTGDPSAAAFVLGMRGLGTVLADLPAGALVSRAGSKRTMLLGLGSIALVVLGFGLSPLVAVLGALSLLFGAGVGLWMLARLDYVAEHCPATHRGRAMTVMAGLNRAGAFLGPALGGMVVTGLGYSVFFALASALAVVGALAVLAFTKPSEPTATAHASVWHAVAHVFRDQGRELVGPGSAAISLQFIRAARQLLIPVWGESIGLDEAQIGLVFSLSSAVDMSMFYIAGRLMDMRGRKWSAVPSIALLTVSLALLPLTSSYWPFLAVALLSGFGNGFGTGIIMTIGADLSPRENRGEFLGVWRFISDSGQAVGPLLLGGVIGFAGLAGTIGLSAGIGLIGTGLMVSAVKETLVRPDRPD